MTILFFDGFKVFAVTIAFKILKRLTVKMGN